MLPTRGYRVLCHDATLLTSKTSLLIYREAEGMWLDRAPVTLAYR
jgi:hypothetical protein